jgi:hypothetical protein
MRIHRLLLFTIVTLSFFCNSTKTMDSVIDIGTATLMPMESYWSQEYTDNLNQIKNININEMIFHLNHEQYLPKAKHSLEHLLYLSTVRNDNETKTPFSIKQQKRFDIAFNTKKSVRIYFCVNAVVIFFTALFLYSNLMALIQCAQSNQTACISQTSALTAPSTITFFGALMVGFMSLYATGILPDISARKADKVQDKVGDLSSKYLTLAKYWIDIYFMYPDKAIDIAQRFDIDALKNRIKLKTHNAKAGEKLVNPLKEAWHFIMHKNILVTFTEIENYLHSKMNAQQIALLCKRIQELESCVHEKDQEIIDLKQIL